MKTILNVKTDKSIKMAAKKVAQEIGLPLGTVVNIFLRQFAKNKEITLSASYKPTKYLEQIFEEAKRDLKVGKIQGPFKTTGELLRSLKS